MCPALPAGGAPPHRASPVNVSVHGGIGEVVQAGQKARQREKPDQDVYTELT